MAVARIIIIDYEGDNVGGVLSAILSAYTGGPAEEAPKAVAPNRETERQRAPLRIPTPAREEPISVLLLGARTENCLRAGNPGGRITTVGQLLDQTEAQVLDCPNLGTVGITSIKASLAARGLRLRAVE